MLVKTVQREKPSRMREICTSGILRGAEGIRTSKVTTETDGKKKTSKYTYILVSDLTEIIYEETEDSIIKYVYGAGSLVSQEVIKKDDSNKDNNDKKEISYFHYDLRGRTIALTNESGKITDIFPRTCHC